MGLSFGELLREVLAKKDMQVLIAGLVTAGLSFAMLTKLFPKKVTRILMVGHYGAGKTTILYKLKRGKVLPTWSFIYEIDTAEYENIIFTVCHVHSCSQEWVNKFWLPQWRHLFQNNQGLIFVVDSNDRAYADDARDELHSLLNEDELRDAPLLVFANKKDLPNAMTAAEITDKLGLQSLRQGHWYIQSTCATSGEGLHEGLDWLFSKIASKVCVREPLYTSR